MPRGNPNNVALGPGMLFAAILGSTEPVDLSTAWPAAWVPLGYTNEGSSFSYSPSFEAVEVAEEIDQIDSIPTGREQSVTFASAEVTAENWKRALNGGTIVLSGTAPNKIATFEPPDLGTETYTMIGFESEDHEERWVWRQCKQTGAVETARRKGAEKAAIPMTFSVYKPATGAKPWKQINIRGVVQS